jgi:23S rRNA pseudouridine2605 synthase
VRDSRPGFGRGRRRPAENDSLEPYTGEMRLNRFISNAGVCSRREADKYIETGLVTINGKIVTELGTKVLPGDEVRFDGKRLFPEKKVYLLLNKPKGFVTTTEDPNAEKTVMDLVKDACPERIYPVGRLDKNTTGLLLFTNDGELSKRLTHPSFESKKIYQVTLDNPLTKNDLQQIADGIELEDGPIAADQISYIDPEEKTEIGIEIHSGRNRIVRRIFEHLGYNVRKLDRVFYAGLTKKDLPRGKWRILSPKEVGFLKMN